MGVNRGRGWSQVQIYMLFRYNIKRRLLSFVVTCVLHDHILLAGPLLMLVARRLPMILFFLVMKGVLQIIRVLHEPISLI